MLSIWNGGICQATFQLPGDQVDLFAETLRHTAPVPAQVSAPVPAPVSAPGRSADRWPDPSPDGRPDRSPDGRPGRSPGGQPGRSPAAANPEVIRTGQHDTQPTIA